MKKRKAPSESCTNLTGNKPFWELGLNPITMQPAILNYFDHTGVSGGINTYKIHKNTNHFVKNYT